MTVELGVVVLVVALVVGGLLSVLKHQYDGRFRSRRADRPHRTGHGTVAPTLDAGDLGVDLGERVTLVQFSSAFCAPCRATHRILTDVAAMVDGVRFVEIDAESNLDLVRRLDILRTPTVLLLDSDGAIVRRASGQPRKVDVIAAIGTVVDRQRAH